MHQKPFGGWALPGPLLPRPSNWIKGVPPWEGEWENGEVKEEERGTRRKGQGKFLP